MKAIILAAGMGNRLLHLTTNIPKCKLKVFGKPIIEHQLDVLRSLGIIDISIVKGFLKEHIDYPETKSYENAAYAETNILMSLFSAEAEFNDDIVVLYGDVIFNRAIMEKLLGVPGDIVLTIEEDWQKGYTARPDNPIEDVEKAYVNDGKIKKIGKHLSPDEANGEFIGIAKFTKQGVLLMKDIYHQSLERYRDRSFHESPSLQKAALTDLLQEIVDCGGWIWTALTRGGWVEIDTLQDLNRAGGEISAPKIAPEVRRGLLKHVLAEKGFARFIEAHSGISGIIANNAVVAGKVEFDGIWISSLTESAVKGQPDIELLGVNSRLATTHEILEVTNKPIIVDGDTGGDPNAFEYFVRKAEGLGVSGVIIEDKVYPKRNSLDADSPQVLEDPTVFAHKIKRGKQALLTTDVMIIARLESLIAGAGLADALKRARCYLEAGADGIMIHSKSISPDEVVAFARAYKTLSAGLGKPKPLVCVPTTYNTITESELKREGFHIVIHANHLLRASIKAMQAVCRIILEHGRSLETEKHLSSVGEVFDLVGFSDIKNKEKTWSL